MADKIEKDHIIAFTRYMKVTRQPQNNNRYWDRDSLQCDDLHNEKGRGVEIRGQELLKQLDSADEYAETTAVTMTKLATLLIEAGVKPFTVCFVKQDGDKRTLRGRLIVAEPLMGRSMVEDLDLPLDDKAGRVRLVDHRTIEWLVINNVRYERK